MHMLNAREHDILHKRYYEDMTQMEIAQELGISQAQVSRLEKNAIRTLKKEMEQVKSVCRRLHRIKQVIECGLVNLPARMSSMWTDGEWLGHVNDVEFDRARTTSDYYTSANGHPACAGVFPWLFSV